MESTTMEATTVEVVGGLDLTRVVWAIDTARSFVRNDGTRPTLCNPWLTVEDGRMMLYATNSHVAARFVLGDVEGETADGPVGFVDAAGFMASWKERKGGEELRARPWRMTVVPRERLALTAEGFVLASPLHNPGKPVNARHLWGRGTLVAGTGEAAINPQYLELIAKTPHPEAYGRTLAKARKHRRMPKDANPALVKRIVWTARSDSEKSAKRPMVWEPAQSNDIGSDLISVLVMPVR